MHAPSRRSLAPVALLLACLFLLTGCFKMDMELTLNDDDTISGSMLIAFDRETMEQFGATEDDFDDLMEDDSGLPEGASIEPYDEDGFIGQKISFDAVSFDEFNAEGGVSVTREGDEYVISLATSELGLDDPSGGMEGFGEFDFEPEVRIAVTFPGEVSETNGSADGNTATWDLADLEGLETLEARGSAIDDGGLSLFLAIGVVGALALLGAGGFFAFRHFQGRGADAPTLNSGAMPGGPQVAVTADYDDAFDASAPAPAPGNPYAQNPYGAAQAERPEVLDSRDLGDWEFLDQAEGAQHLAETPAPAQPTPVSSAPAIAAGWYPTADGATLRYHDGSDWTEHVQPVST